MEILIYNVSWMLWNSFLAILPVGFAFIYFKYNNTFLKIFMAVLWFLYLPNSLYVISDIEHLVSQWPRVTSIERIGLFIQYVHLIVIGLTAFLMSMYAFEKELRRFLKKQSYSIPFIIVSLNFLIGFAMVMGKVERVNSWEVFTAPGIVIAAVVDVGSNNQLMLLAVLFAVFGNCFYFLFRDPVIRYFRRYAHHVR